jgi:hypothetical protein
VEAKATRTTADKPDRDEKKKKKKCLCYK